MRRSGPGPVRRAVGGVAVLALVLVAGAGYVVQPGENLTVIARKLGTTVGALVDANDIPDPDHVTAGTTLTVPGGGGGDAPAPPSPGGTHVVRRGESLSVIARDFGVTTEALAEANGIDDPHRIVVGQRLTIPARGGSSPVAPAGSESRIHTVRPGEALSTIARANGLTTQALADANGIRDHNLIYVGQRLVVPGSGGGPAAAPTTGPAGIPRADAERVIEQVAREYGWNPAWIKALAWQESGWQMGVVSSAGAVGIMQVMPGTGRFVSRSLLGRDLDLTDPYDNVTAGVAFVDYLFDLTGGDIDLTLAGYYQGLGNVRRYGMASDTKRYIANIKALKQRFS